MTMSDDEQAVTFVLDPRARWHDGRPVTTDDIVYTIKLLSEHGRPGFRPLWKRVTPVVIDARTIRFDIADALPRLTALEISQLRVLPKHFWETREFDRTTFEPPLGSGPYRVAAVHAEPLGHLRARAPTTGAATCRRCAAATISIASSTTITSTRPRSSRPSSKAISTFTSRPIRGAGRSATTRRR